MSGWTGGCRPVWVSDDFPARPWHQVVAHFADLPDWAEPLRQIVAAAVHGGAPGRLDAFTSMHELLVAPADRAPGPVEHLRITLFVGEPGRDRVRIRHHTAAGHDDEVTVDSADGPRLLWRFVIEKFGLQPWRWESLTEPQRQAVLAASEEAGLWELCTDSTIVDESGARLVPGLSVAAAQQAVGELLRLGIVEVWTDADTPPLADDALVTVFGDERLWTVPHREVMLGFTAAGEHWYHLPGRGVLL